MTAPVITDEGLEEAARTPEGRMRILQSLAQMRATVERASSEIARFESALARTRGDLDA